MKIPIAVLILLAAAGLALGSGPTRALAQTAPPKGPVLVYETSRPNLDVKTTRRGNRMWRVNIGAPGACDNGEAWESGFAVIAGIGLPIYPNETFHLDRNNQLFRGRFEGDKVVGLFRETGFEVGGSTEVFPPTCGNTRPGGRNQHFVARLVERNHRKVGGGG